MRFSKFAISHNNKGITPVKFNRKNFGHVVALVGTNGSGKTRALSLIKDFVNNISITEFKDKFITHMSDELSALPVVNANGIAQFSKKAAKYIRYIDLASVPQAVTLGGLLSGSSEVYENMRKDGGNEFNSVGIDSTFEYVKDLTISIADFEVSNYVNQRNLKKEDTESAKYLTRLNYYLELFIGKKFKYDLVTKKGGYDTIINFEGRPFAYNELSPGQKILYRYAIMFYLYEVMGNINVGESILFIDEPETHLHPHFQIELIDRLSKLVQDKGQLWIATHSIHILAHLDYEDVIMVKDGQLLSPSKKNHTLLYKELIKIESHIAELTEYVTSISNYHYSNFIRECFRDPQVVSDITVHDKQFLQLKEMIQGINRMPGAAVLDFGAGRGRIAQAFFDEDALTFDYHAYDIDSKNLEYIQSKRLAKGIWNNLAEIPTGKFLFVIMCNVLHEIPPSEWKSIFSRIKTCLTDDGYLLVLEDLQLVRGEKAHDFGYLLLSDEELRTLFDPQYPLLLKPASSSSNDRLMMSVFRKADLEITDLDVRNSIAALEENTLDKIKDIRASKPTDSQARLYAHYTQLYINAKLFNESQMKKKLPPQKN